MEFKGFLKAENTSFQCIHGTLQYFLSIVCYDNLKTHKIWPNTSTSANHMFKWSKNMIMRSNCNGFIFNEQLASLQSSEKDKLGSWLSARTMFGQIIISHYY